MSDMGMKGCKTLMTLYGIRVNISNRMSLKMDCFISQRRYGYDLVLDISSSFVESE
jgi:hypothetical protein